MICASDHTTPDASVLAFVAIDGEHGGGDELPMSVRVSIRALRAALAYFDEERVPRLKHGPLVVLVEHQHYLHHTARVHTRGRLQVRAPAGRRRLKCSCAINKEATLSEKSDE